LGTLAISYLMAFASLAVLVFFVRNPGLDNNWWRTKVAPVVGMLGLLGVAGYATWKFSFLIGSDNALKWVLPALVPLFALVGVISAEMLRRREPDAFEQMGKHRETIEHPAP